MKKLAMMVGIFYTFRFVLDASVTAFASYVHARQGIEAEKLACGHQASRPTQQEAFWPSMRGRMAWLPAAWGYDSMWYEYEKAMSAFDVYMEYDYNEEEGD